MLISALFTTVKILKQSEVTIIGKLNKYVIMVKLLYEKLCNPNFFNVDVYI